ncbi:MAG: ATP-binding protein [bacterium]
MSSYPLFDDFRKRQEKIQEELKRIRELSVLHEISKSMQTLNLDEILHLILDGVTKAIGFDRTRLYLINEEKMRLECKMAVGIEKEKIEGITLLLNKENSMLARSVIEKKPFVVGDALNDPRVNKDLKKRFGLKSFAVVPLIGRDRVVGAITADNLFSDRVITPEKFESLITFANQAGLALENAKMYDELKSFSRQLEEKVKIATEDLKRTQDRLIQSEKLAVLGKLSAGIAHEIRNPLTSIKILIHSLAKKITDTETKEKDIKVIENEIERVNQTIKRFLDFARPKEPQFSRVDINQILEETINLVSGKVKEQNIILEKEFSSLSHIQADREQMRQVFLNLFLNAVQAMPEGGKLRIKTDLQGQYIRIEIQDEGRGIPERIKNKLFEPFFTTKEEGIGLGLSIVKRIIDDHKGSIQVRDSHPQGTVFTINLPINPK